MCNEPEPFEQTWKRVTQGTFLPSFIKFDPLVLEKKLFEWKVDDARTHARTHGRTDGRTTDDGQLGVTKAHLEHFVLRWAKNSCLGLIEAVHQFNAKCNATYAPSSALSGILSSVQSANLHFNNQVFISITQNFQKMFVRQSPTIYHNWKDHFACRWPVSTIKRNSFIKIWLVAIVKIFAVYCLCHEHVYHNLILSVFTYCK